MHLQQAGTTEPMVRPRGQAPALRQVQWRQWLAWLREGAGPHIYFVIFLTGALGLRCSEALTLRREDIFLDGPTPKIVIAGRVAGAKKSPGEVYVRKQHVMLIRKILREGITAQRTRGHKHGKGPKSLVTFTKTWHVPKAGYIFPARRGAKKGHLHYQAVYHHIARETKHFARHLAKLGQPVAPELSKLRPHSGRATLITELMGEGMTTAMSMKYARHAPDSFKVHLKYGRLSLEDVKNACDLLPSSRPRAKWSSLSTKELLAAQKGIQKELQKRLAAS
jgi:integrase